jgi:glycogen synthase
MRIVLAPSAYYPHVGGIEELTRQLALTLRSRGHDVSVLTNRWPAGVVRREVLDGVDVTRLAFPLPAARPFNAARFLFAAPGAIVALLRHLRRRKPDVIHIIGAGPQSVYLATLAPLLRARLVFTAQGELTFDAHDVFTRSASLRFGLRRILGRADAVTACSAFVLDGLRRFGPLRADALVIPNGVEPDEFAHLEPAVSERPYVLAVGRLVPQKGFDILIEALAAPALSDLELWIAGEGPAGERLEALAADAGIANRVRLLGSIERESLARILVDAHIFALPSRGEPFGIALLEAMAAGVPSVATRAGGVIEFARDDDNAVLVEQDDAAGLARAISRLNADSVLRKRLAAAGRSTARDLSWRRISSRYEEVYAGAIARSSASTVQVKRPWKLPAVR